MTTFGYFLATEEFGPADLLQQAVWAEEAGFDALWISDHYHPWNDEQGESPFVWSVIGALSQVTSLPVTTAVTCPTVRIQPTVIAQAAMTSNVMLDGQFFLGVGTGEALNEHIHGDAWPRTEIRLDMLEEAVEVMRMLFTGEEISYAGAHYTVENARLYTVTDEPPPILVSAFGPKAAEVAGRIGDGLVSTKPDADLIDAFNKAGGAGRTTQGGIKVCWDQDRDTAVDTVHRLWPNHLLPGEMAQILPTPDHFMQATDIVTREMVADSPTPCGPDLEEHLKGVRAYVDAGYDEVYIGQIGPKQQDFFEVCRQELLPELRR